MTRGRIISVNTGVYTLETESGERLKTVPRGILRRQGIKPVCGDFVFVDSENCIDSLEERKNVLVRPPVANMDLAVYVASIRDPEPSPEIIARFLLEAERIGLPSALVFNKTDLVLDAHETEITELIYEACRLTGVPVFEVCSYRAETLEKLKSFLDGKVSVFSGPSGAGKSSLINALTGSSNEVGAISSHLARGKNTTRTSSLIPLGRGYIADTPGFTSFTLREWGFDELNACFAEIEAYNGKCRFLDCRHIKEPGCAVKQAVDEKKISRLRYETYCGLYTEIKKKSSY